MAVLIKGQLHNYWHDTAQSEGEFVREESRIRHYVGAEGSPFKVAAGRYRLYAAYDSWSHRAVLARAVKALDEIVSLEYVDPVISEKGWRFNREVINENSNEHLFEYVYQLYLATDPNFTGRISLPLLWDTQNRCIVSNESADIMRMFDDAFNDLLENEYELRPEAWIDQIEVMNDYVYKYINNGVYKVGFATAQWAYNEALKRLFEGMAYLERHLRKNRYLICNQPTESDWRLFVSLVRFDTIYYSCLRCNKKRLKDFQQLWNYTRELYQMPHVAETVNMDKIRETYYTLSPLNPSGIIPGNPDCEFESPTLAVRYQVYSAPLKRS